MGTIFPTVFFFLELKDKSILRILIKCVNDVKSILLIEEMQLSFKIFR